MAISFIAAAGATTNVVAIPGSATNGDAIIVLACNQANATYSATPTGCTQIRSQTAGSGGIVLAYTFKSAGSGANISASAATHIQLVVFRNTVVPVPVGGSSATGGAVVTSAVPIGGVTMNVTDGTSWICAGYFHNRTTALSEPATMTEHIESVSGSKACAMASTNAGVASFAQTTAVGAAARNMASIAVEILASAAAASGPGPNMFTRGLTGCGLKWVVDDWLPLPGFEMP